MGIRRERITAGAILLAALATPVFAQPFNQQVAQCENGSGLVTPSEMIAACSALVRSGRFAGPRLSMVFSNRGNAYARDRDPLRAIPDYDEAIRLDSRNARAYFNRGSAYNTLGDRIHAIADFDEAIRLNPQYASAYHNRGSAYANRGDLVRAIADYDQAIRLDPQLASAYLNRALARERLGDAAGAAADRAAAARLRGR